MALDLTKYGITGSTVIAHNPSYEDLYKAEVNPALEGYEKGKETELGAVNVMTGFFTGPAPHTAGQVYLKSQLLWFHKRPPYHNTY